MNWLLIVILALIIGNVIWGYKMGFMKVALSLVSWVVVLVACYIATPIIAEGVVKHTPLAEVIQETVTDKLNSAIDEVMDGVAGSLNAEQIAEINEQIPEQIRTIIYGEGKTLEDLITSTGEIEVDTTALADAAAYLVALLIVIIVTRIALLVVEKMLDLVAKLPLIGQANTLLGIGAGALKGLIWSWVVLTVVAVLIFTGANADLMLLITESPILFWLYANNPIVMAIVHFI